MNKKRIMKTMLLMVALVLLMGTIALASTTSMKYGGEGYLYVSSSSGMTRVQAGTSIGSGRTGDLSLTKLTTSYEDGTTKNESDGLSQRNTSIDHGWEWAYDYSSVHALYSSVTTRYDRKTLGWN